MLLTGVLSMQRSGMPTVVFCSGVLHHKWPCNVDIDVGCGAWLASVTGKMLGERESLAHGAEV